MGKIEKSKRNSVFTELKEFCVFSGQSDFIEVTEWTNGEGVDVYIASKEVEKFSLSWGQYEALKKCVKKIYK